MSRALICPPDRRGHTWHEPAPGTLPKIPRDLLFVLRVCRRCGAIGRVNSQGVVMATGSVMKDAG